MAATVPTATRRIGRHRLLPWVHILAAVAEGISLVVAVPLPLAFHLALLVGLQVALIAADLRVWPP